MKKKNLSFLYGSLIIIFIIIFSGCISEESLEQTYSTGVSPITHNSDSNQTFTETGFSLSQIKNRNGVYIKRGQIFYELSSQRSLNGYSENNRKLYEELYMEKENTTYTFLEPESQLVFVGSEPYLYSLSYSGYNAVSSGYIYYAKSNGENRLSWVDSRYSNTLYSNFNFNGKEYESNMQFINDNGASLYKFDDYQVLVDRNFDTYSYNPYYLLVGDMGQEFIFGQWGGTNWNEIKLTVDVKVFNIEPIDYTVEKTYDGYFIINFDRNNKFIGFSERIYPASKFLIVG